MKIAEIVDLEHVRDRDAQAQAAASAEVRALQARMHPHFLFNALNTLAALATVAPREIPRAAGRLRHFLGASFDQHDRTLILPAFRDEFQRTTKAFKKARIDPVLGSSRSAYD